jgi:hypothetical protein
MMDGARNQEVVDRIRKQIASGDFRLTAHAQQEMVDESIWLDDLISALCAPELLENYPEDRRGPSCLVLGYSLGGRPIHVVCTANQPTLVVITVYEPSPPKWQDPRQRGTP